MVSIVALEKMIKDLEVRIAIAKGQLARDKSEEEKLSLLAKSSAENSLDKHTYLLDIYQKMLKEFEKFEHKDSYEHRRLRSAIERKKYYKYSKKKDRHKKRKFRENDERIEAAMIIDELPEDIILDSEDLYVMSFKNMEHYLNFGDDPKKELTAIQEEFNNLIKNFTDENIKNLELLNYMIPILIFHFHIFHVNIVNQIVEEDEEPIEMDPFPKYHDWWIHELWESHIAYFSLIKWKNNITSRCKSEHLEKAWRAIFNNWIFVKTLLSEKSDLAFEYQYIFDSLVKKYANFESELDKKIVKAAEKEIESFIEEEEILALIPEHQVLTPYINYKLSNKKNL